VDGVIEVGETEIDRAALTGESLPVFAGPGAEVSAGEVNLTGVLTVRVTARGEDTRLHRIANLVALAETARNRYTSLADRAARAYAPGVFVLGFVAFAGWMVWSGDLRTAVNVAIATLIITCPCALGLAVPAVVTAASGRLYRAGVLLKSGTALERLAEVDTVVFDKTGTLTLGLPEADAPLEHGAEALALAAGLARGSSHPLAQALRQAAETEGVEPAVVTALREVPGHGVEGLWQGQRLRLGRAAWAGTDAGAGTDRTATWLAVQGQPLRAYTFTDRPRPGAAETVAALVAAGCRVLLFSGDSRGAVAQTAARIGIAEWRAALTPEEKLAEVEALSVAGARVLMVGDGLNDTGALAAAHVSAAPGSALDVARVASDIVILGQRLDALADCLATARRARARISENFAISWVYNAVAVPIALAGLVTPFAAALAMSASSISVSLNALRLLRGSAVAGVASAPGRPGHAVPPRGLSSTPAAEA
ncbi:MAG: ATPase, partial [Alphaproteobacteria bacterium HGW-Alphaproteobacteria-2]